ncbi:hypothetical protein [Halalkalibacter sp. APA_J-10(15)]|nr:hypothetical protein [Halalkalibacter sp. APA_J-10(15)]
MTSISLAIMKREYVAQLYFMQINLIIEHVQKLPKKYDNRSVRYVSSG